MLIRQQDDRVFVLSAASDLIYTTMETSGMINLWRNIIHLVIYEQIPVYVSQDNSLKTTICSQHMSYHEETYMNIYVKTPHFTKNMNKYELKNI